MQAVNGYFEDGHFTPIGVTPLPRRFPAVLVFNEADAEDDGEKKPKRSKEQIAAWLARLDTAIDLSMGEDLPDFPPRTPMRLPLDLTD